jgi:putative membrane protein
MAVHALLLHATTQFRWTDWSVHWSTVVGIAALGGLYEWRARKVDAESRAALPGASSSGAGQPAQPADPRAAPSVGQRILFFTGLLVIFASLNGPVHDLSDYYLFAGHMVQHLLLTLVLPPLLLAGVTGEMLRPLIRHRAVRAVARRLTSPFACYAIFNVVLAAWHLPPLYNAAMASHGIHVVEHLMFMSCAVLMWWPLMSPLPELPRLAYPGQMLYCFLMSLPMSIVAIYIAMADHVLYPAYASAPRLWGITPLEDQHIGGLVMWIPGGLYFYGVMTVVFFKWSQRQEDSTAGAQVNWRPAVNRSA